MRLLALLLVLCHGCSWIFVDGPPAGAPPGAQVECTETNLVPVIDAIVAGFATIGAFYFLAAGESETDRTVGPLVEGGIALGFGISSYQGFGKTSRCRAIHRR